MVLTPYMEFTADYQTLCGPSQGEWWTKGFWHQTVPSRNDKKGRYYTQKYYRADKPTDTPVAAPDIKRSFSPFTETGPEQYEFKYSAIGDSTDTISKIGVLACMLVIGDKCVVETGTQGQISDFEWRTYKTREECASDDEYYAQSLHAWI